jgi:hypothetical protein
MTDRPGPSVGAASPVGRGHAVLPLMTETEVAKLCGVQVQTVRRWRRLGSDRHGCGELARSSTTPAAMRDRWNDGADRRKGARTAA